MMKISPNGIKLIKSFEKCFLKAYQGAADRKGVITIGWGHVIVLNKDKWANADNPIDTEITQKFADDLFAYEIDKDYSSKVYAALTHEPTQAQFDAMTSFAYNIGTSGFRSSQVCQAFNAFDMQKSADGFRNWISSAGQKRLGLIRRRAAEKAFFMTGQLIYDDIYSGKVDPFVCLGLNKGIIE